MRGLIRVVLPLAVVAAAGAGAAMATTAATHASRGTVKMAKIAAYGDVLVNASGRTLYRYTPDRKKVSVCKGQCLAYWPALLVGAKAKPVAGPGVKQLLLSTIKAAGGKRQVTYAGFPLYLYVGDKKAGEVTGEGVAKTWYVVNSNGALVKHAAAASTTGGNATPPATTTTSGGGGGGGSAWG